MQTYVGHGQAVYDAATTKDNSRIASCGGDKQVRFVAAPSDAPPPTLGSERLCGTSIRHLRVRACLCDYGLCGGRWAW